MLILAARAEAPADTGSLDPAFARVPFERWFSAGEQARLHWTAHLTVPQLSSHQRLLTRVEILVDGADLAKRRGRGRLVIFVQLADRNGTPYQTHGLIELGKLEEGIKAQNITYTQPLFVTPGDYTVSFALLDTATEEHATRREKLHVAALKNDPLPNAWNKLPAVEFLSSAETPDNWYLPEVTGKLDLSARTAHAARIGVLVNLTPSERLSGSHRVQDRNLGMLIPALKALSQVDLRNAALDVSLLDLSRRRVVFQQNEVHDLDWARLKGSLAEADPGTIDVKALSDRSRSAAFFVKEVARRVGVAKPEQESSHPARALIVLTSPVAFEEGEDLQPIQTTGTPACPVYYFRIHAAAPLVRRPMPFQPNRRFGEDAGPFHRPIPNGPPPLADQLEATLKPLGPRLFDIETPEQFRRALATVLAEISSL